MVGTVRMLIEPSAKHLIAKITHSPYTTKIARITHYTMLSSIFKCQAYNIQ